MGPFPLDLPDQEGNVISIEVARTSYHRRQEKECGHWRILLDPLLANVECRDCHAALNPVEWIRLAAERWQAIKWLYERQSEAARQLDLKRRSKCEHCGRISRVRHPTGAEVRAWDEQDRQQKIARGDLVIIPPKEG